MSVARRRGRNCLVGSTFCSGSRPEPEPRSSVMGQNRTLRKAVPQSGPPRTLGVLRHHRRLAPPRTWSRRPVTLAGTMRRNQGRSPPARAAAAVTWPRSSRSPGRIARPVPLGRRSEPCRRTGPSRLPRRDLAALGARELRARCGPDHDACVVDHIVDREDVGVPGDHNGQPAHRGLPQQLQHSSTGSSSLVEMFSVLTDPSSDRRHPHGQHIG